MNWALLANSLLVSGAATLLAVVFGFAAALCCCGGPIRLRNFMLGCGAVALALPPFLVANSWLHFLGQTGVWRSWLPFSIVSPAGAVWILALLNWPITLFFVWSEWQKMDASLLEADPAINGWSLLRGVLWPLARGPLLLAGALTLILSLNNFAVPALLQVKVLPAEMWVRFNTLFDAAGAVRLGWPLIVIPLLMLGVARLRKISWPASGQAVSPRVFRNQIGPGWFALSIVTTALIAAVSVALPILQLLTVKRTWIEFSGALAAGKLAVWNSAWLSVASALLIIGLCLVPLTFRHRRRSSSGLPFNVVDSALWLPFLAPGVLLGIALIMVFNRPELVVIYQSTAIVILALAIRYFAIGWTAIDHAVDSIDRDVTDAARLSGASKLRILRNILWPEIAGTVALTWYVLFLFCLWDVESTILIMPPGLETLAARIFNLLHYGHNPQINALCLILLLVAVAPLVLWSGFRVVSGRVEGQGTRNTQYAIRNTAAILLALLFPACSPSPSGSTSLKSELFSHVQVIGSRGVGVGQFNKPRSVAVDQADNVLAVDMTGRVQKFSPDGRFLLSWQMPQTDLGKPKGMCRDREGNILVLEPHYQRVNQFSPAGKLISQWGVRGTNAGEFMLPRAVAVNSRNEIFVSEYQGMERVQRFKWIKGGTEALPGSAQDASANVVHARESSPVALVEVIGHAGTAQGEFNRPEGICVDSKDQIYVADSCNHRIEIFSPDGKFLRSHGKAGNGSGDLSYPYDICVDKAGRQYVCEFGNSRVQVFDANDKPIEIIGGPGAEPGRFSNPWGVALDSAGNLYVADSQNHRVQKLIRRQSVASSQSSVAKNQSELAASSQSAGQDLQYRLRTTDYGL